MTRALHRGIYDVTEVARLIKVTPDTVSRWTTPTRHGKQALVTPSLGWAFSFHDLVSLRVVGELRRRNVKADDIRAGIKYLKRQLGTNRPLAHKRLATVGVAFFANLAEVVSAPTDWVNVGRGGQAAFREIIEPALRPIDYDEELMASRWRPAKRVWIDPQVQAGAPCIADTRIPTAAVAGLVHAGDDREDVAADLEISIENVDAAVDFEDRLAA